MDEDDKKKLENDIDYILNRPARELINISYNEIMIKLDDIEKRIMSIEKYLNSLYLNK